MMGECDFALIPPKPQAQRRPLPTTAAAAAAAGKPCPLQSPGALQAWRPLLALAGLGLGRCAGGGRREVVVVQHGS